MTETHELTLCQEREERQIVKEVCEDAKAKKELLRIESILGSEALVKACFDNPFDYALKLRTGEVVSFTGAKVLSNEWVHLDVSGAYSPPPENLGLPYSAERGVDVRISDIVWVMDAPNGS